ncbi:DUF2442 domain-containing protein [Vibrio metschnikovii]|uniref:DUF2442 domain-containing protein n=1 Tax=Vibrio metschnikovii TaxID=28172 RepID=UPI001C303F98|nr:DUF2442 domain-containing protein [Vibrio metschnikovii]
MYELSVVKTKHVADHILEIEFSDKHVSVVDFAPFIFGNGHPDYDKYKDASQFLTFQLLDGNLNWDDYTMVFPIEDLYRNAL